MKQPSRVIRRPGGAPATLVLAPGWACDSSIWEPIVSHLGRFDLAFVELPGAGSGGAPPVDAETWSLDLAAGAFAAALKASGEGPRIAVGHSMSGVAALRMAAASGPLLAGVVTICSNPRPLRCEGWDFGFAPEEAHGATSFLREGADFPSALVALLRASGLPEPDAEAVEGAAAVLSACARRIRSPQAAIQLLERFFEVDIRGLLPRVGVPVLLVHGERDGAAPTGAGAFMAEHLPGAEMVVIPEAGHYPQLTRPAAVARAIEEFVSEIG